MKYYVKIIVVFLGLFHGFVFSQDKNIDLNWQTNFEKAKELAKEQHKHILIYFTGSDWSEASKTLNKEFFYTEKFQKIAQKHLILVRVNEPRRKDLISEFQEDSNQKLSKKYKQKVIPTVVLAKANGDEIGKVERYNYLGDTSKHYKLVEMAIKD